MKKGIQVIVTGTTGMVGEGVARQAILNPKVDKVLLVSRRPSLIRHPKVEELLVSDFFHLENVKLKLEGYDACLFALGVSSVGMKEDQYRKLTYDLTMNFARTLKELNPNMTFCYISGAHTDSTEKGRSMWARVKGKTENDLMKLFDKAYMFRPGFMKPDKGAHYTLGGYKYMTWLFPVLKLMTPNFVSTLAEMGRAMVHAATQGYEKRILEVPDIKILAARKDTPE